MIRVMNIRQVPAAIKRAIAGSGIEQVMLAAAKRRIDKSGDSQIRYPPLADLSGMARAFWQTENQRRFRLLFGGRQLARQFGRVTSGKMTDPLTGKKLQKMPPVGVSFRAGGTPLLDTRQHIYNALHARKRQSAGRVTFLVQSGGPTPLVAVYHHHGYKTKGPNFVPLSLKARRTHRTGANPRSEGLVPGVDYVMFWRGVKVPARPIVRFPPEDRREVVEALKAALR